MKQQEMELIAKVAAKKKKQQELEHAAKIKAQVAKARKTASVLD